MTEPLKAFISYSHADRSQVVPLASYIDRLGLEVWLDTKELKGGDSLIEAVSDAISTANAYVVCLSPASVQSPWVRHELSVALALETEQGKPKVLPVLLAKTDIPAMLAGRMYVDISTSFDAGRESIRRFVDANFAELGTTSEKVADHPQLQIASVELELTKETVKSYGGFSSEDTRRNVEEEAAELVRALRRRANGVLLNFVPVTQMDLESRYFTFPNGEITTRTEDRAGDFSGTVGQRAVVAVQVLNPDERKLEELVSSKLESLGVSKATSLREMRAPEQPIKALALRTTTKRMSRSLTHFSFARLAGACAAA
jgi:hypothetical protein